MTQSSLFHFTPKFEYLQSILRVGFNHHINREELPLRGREKPTHLGDILANLGAMKSMVDNPLVCFADMVLDRTREHSDQYGKHAIGLTKDWAKSNAITPARYIHENSPDLTDSAFHDASDFIHAIQSVPSIADFYASAFKIVLKDQPVDIQKALIEMFRETEKYGNYIRTQVFLLKEYEGEWIDRMTQERKTRTFYEEREWRSSSFPDPKYNLKFMADDITHIVVTTLEEVEIIIDQIRSGDSLLDPASADTMRGKMHLLDQVVSSVA